MKIVPSPFKQPATLWQNNIDVRKALCGFSFRLYRSSCRVRILSSSAINGFFLSYFIVISELRVYTDLTSLILADLRDAYPNTTVDYRNLKEALSDTKGSIKEGTLKLGHLPEGCCRYAIYDLKRSFFKTVCECLSTHIPRIFLWKYFFLETIVKTF